MKRTLLSLILGGLAVAVSAQVGTITVTVDSSEPVTGLTTIHYEFTGIEGRTYNLRAEVKFDDADYVAIPQTHLSGDLADVSGTGTAFSGTIVWDGAAGFPNRLHQQTRVRLTAQHFLSGEGVTDIDGNFYPTAIIGNQEWMAENLRVTKYNNGDAISTGLTDGEWGSTTSGAYAFYPHEGGATEDDVEGINSDVEMVAAYGKLYNWFAVYDSRGLCPEGWSVPSDDDWTALVNYVVSQGFPDASDNPNGAGNALKSCRQAGHHPDGGDCDTSEHPRWNSDVTHHGFDEFGFSALPSGYCDSNGGYVNIGLGGYWWSSSEHSSSRAWYRGMVSYYGRVFRLSSDKRNGFSVKCFRVIDN